MVTRKKNIRSLQDIHTMSGNIDMVAQPYRAYMKISCLEMEKARRGNERESAMRRVRNIDERFRQIEVEKAALLQILGKTECANAADAGGTKPRSGRGIKSKAAAHQSKRGFTIRY